MPRDACTLHIESSTVTRLRPVSLHVDFGAAEARHLFPS